MPAVSVLLPVRDEAPFLAESLASLSAQTLRDFEAIVVDDGSADDSAAIAEGHARRDQRFRVLRQGREGLPRLPEAAELLRVHVQELARPLPLVAARAPINGAFGPGKSRTAMPAQHLPDRRGRMRNHPRQPHRPIRRASAGSTSLRHSGPPR